MFFVDGASPPKEIIQRWLELVASTFSGSRANGAPKPCIAVHCIAGLGRYVLINIIIDFIT